jgi:H+-transporting ATPase
MADTTTGVHAGHTDTSSDATPPNHLGQNIPSGQFDEKKELPSNNGTAEHDTGRKIEEAEEDDEDIDALIEELESQDAGIDAEDEEVTQPGGARPVAEDLLQTDTRHGLTSQEVAVRRKKFGLNQMKEEKENLILKFLGYFIGPIQFVMEVSQCCPMRANSYRRVRIVYFTC